MMGHAYIATTTISLSALVLVRHLQAGLKSSPAGRSVGSHRRFLEREVQPKSANTLRLEPRVQVCSAGYASGRALRPENDVL